MKVFSLIFLLSFFGTSAQSLKQLPLQLTQDSLLIRGIFDEALVHGKSYSQLNYLCKQIGHRLTGSESSAKAIDWAESEMKKLPLDRVFKQGFYATHWVRGDKEWAAVSEEVDIPIQVFSLGGSVSTDGPLQGEVVIIDDIDALSDMPQEQIYGKIVLFNKAMDKRFVNTFNAYSNCVSQRYSGASAAAKKGAIAVLVRSLTTVTDGHPHTGSMGYDSGVVKIPAAAISTQDADILEAYVADFGTVKVTINLNCETMGNIYTHNVIGEIKGSSNSKKVIIVGAHLDTWDKGEGAHDDGAGVVQCLEVLRIFKTLGISPKHTIRAVLYMNEENGNMGGKTYASEAKKRGEEHIFALESDRGGFSPRGFMFQASDTQIEKVKDFQLLLDEYELQVTRKGFGGVDIGPLKNNENLVNPNLMLAGLYPDSQRYFDFHHTDQDVFENVNQRELELGGAAMATLIYLMDKYWEFFE